jgi:hypothetical protein
MRHLVAITGALIAAIATVGVLAPEHLVALVSGLSPDTRLQVAVGTRLVLGVVFIVGAPQCRVPVVIYGVGILALAAALLLVLLGEPRVDALIHWWTQQPSAAIRAWCTLAALVGAGIVYCALPRGRRAV